MFVPVGQLCARFSNRINNRRLAFVSSSDAGQMLVRLDMRVLRVLCLLGSLVFVGVCSSAFELQDIIHALMEENVRLHDQLENLTSALKELHRFLFNHGNGIQFFCYYVYIL